MKTSSILLYLIMILHLTGCTDRLESLDSPSAKSKPTPIPSAPLPTPTPVATDYIFDIEAVPTITLTVTTKEWNQLLAYYDANAANEECMVGAWQFDKNGVIDNLDSVGVRLRGNTSRQRPEGEYGQWHQSEQPSLHLVHLSIKFKEFKKQTFRGTDKLILKFAKDDPTYLREVYCYDLFRRFGVWIAPKSSFCQLKIHFKEDQKTYNYGVYHLVEQPDDQFLTDRKSMGLLQGDISDGGNLWKMGWVGSDNATMSYHSSIGQQMGIEMIDPTNDSNSQRFVYDYKSKKKNLQTAKAQYISFIQNLNRLTGSEFEQWIESAMDVDLFLRAYAVNVMVGMWDDYWINGNNYYIYFDSNGKAYFLPWDYDNTLGTSNIIANSATQDLLKWGDLTNRPLTHKILSIPVYQSRYKDYIIALADSRNGYFDPASSIARLSEWRSQISPYISYEVSSGRFQNLNPMRDEQANWSNRRYRLFSGDDSGNDNANFFKSKVKSIYFTATGLEKIYY